MHTHEIIIAMNVICIKLLWKINIAIVVTNLIMINWLWYYDYVITIMRQRQR